MHTVPQPRLFAHPASSILLRVRWPAKIRPARISPAIEKARRDFRGLSAIRQGAIAQHEQHVATSWTGDMIARGRSTQGKRWRERKKKRGRYGEGPYGESESALFFVQAPTDTDRLIEKLTGGIVIDRSTGRANDRYRFDWLRLTWHGDSDREYTVTTSQATCWHTNKHTDMLVTTTHQIWRFISGQTRAVMATAGPRDVHSCPWLYNVHPVLISRHYTSMWHGFLEGENPEKERVIIMK
jgi:hypothetical protein